MWKKEKTIEGVSSSSILTLKSIVSNEEQLIKEQGITHSKPVKSMRLNQDGDVTLDNKLNKGVNQRNEKDIEFENSSRGQNALEKSHNSLLIKSKLYNKLLNKRTDDNDSDSDEERREDNENQLIDFQRKKEDESNNDNNNNKRIIPTNMYHPDFEREKKRKLWEEDIRNELNEDDNIEELEEIKKLNKIEQMKREEELTRQNRAKAQLEKENQNKEQQDRLDLINKQKKLALLKQKLKEKQQPK
ncbi:hypothetical protein DICPUDRAFT_90164 [Dictyostelium purpureum]|uniref:Uncharacterized protein n=1 Tax=Dictyostelium purpureum TaxID=5786 RepID=F1A0P7_DICPU|nr:uncharacterized protein DICPUDRAFT_90164 [Dictyostelium purpureum]EGC30226.1 hypothetical protein DICPUDRAFT_90164 [Dictyostelium purpureum]|eukprot:XP_003293240.1 hypothetical protein DICPUDRAFT_90164 [Dictyostelium purpureum]